MSSLKAPSMDEWLKEAKADENASKCGMYLFHNGTVRETARDLVRNGLENSPVVSAMFFEYNEERLDAAIAQARKMPGIYYVRVWLNRGELSVGEDIMLVLIGGDIRQRVVEALTSLVEEIKTNCVSEKEIY